MKNAVVLKERGNARLGFLTLVLFLAISGYLGYRIIPVYLEQDAFHDGLLSLAGRATKSGWNLLFRFLWFNKEHYGLIRQRPQ